MTYLIIERKVISMIIVLLIFIIAVLVSSCCYTGSNIDSVGYINKNLGFEIQNAYVICDYDTHGGFHGDGDRYIRIKVEDNDFEKRIKDSFDWCSEKTSDIEIVLQDIEEMVKKEGGELPEFKNAYYYMKEDTELKGYPHYLLVIIYDRDAKELHYYELDI